MDATDGPLSASVGQTNPLASVDSELQAAWQRARYKLSVICAGRNKSVPAVLVPPPVPEGRASYTFFTCNPVRLSKI